MEVPPLCTKNTGLCDGWGNRGTFSRRFGVLPWGGRLGIPQQHRALQFPKQGGGDKAPQRSLSPPPCFGKRGQE